MAYQAVIGAAKAARAAATAPAHGIPKYMEVIFPVVIVGGKLFECYLSDEGQIAVEERDEVVLVWRRDVVDVHTIVHVVTAWALDVFARGASETAEGLLTGAIAHEFWAL